jgi:ornithine cyclodeaminase/alanine dehydrogenase-like protein (mu-crystallin family)
MQFVDAAAVHTALPWPRLIEELRRRHNGPAPATARAVLQEPRPDGQPNVLLAIPAWQPGQALGCKLVASFPGNQERYGIPTVNAIYAIFDPLTGVPRAVIDGEALIFRKTAADSALGSSLLARHDCETMLMVGAGSLAHFLVAAHRTARPSIRRVLVWNRAAPRAEALVTKLRADGVEASVAPELDAALGEADLVSSATMSETPLISGAALKLGAHIDLVGSFTLAMREADDVALARARIFCDTRDCIDRTGELADPIGRGVINRDAIEGDLFDLCRGTSRGRRSPDEITLYKNGGGGHLDLFVSQCLFAQLAALQAASARD